ncbi:ATP-dependent DNA ligase [Cupriavidus pauculus]|uniref:ATP-dependent DNA ligase n=1 Tax=Cupriavidus pauculus TaxID=82633 RepID=UPI001248DF30|nr:ATP-dependent DNA ligase [Cupriavidus pauculus]KAB0605114.1 ATP-dependent DNA ligase [Cupriavidus pauculus]UAK99470.1 ATP-dependent DNA ligase [Cupriavidus pauculus]
MKAFADLYSALDGTTSSNAKLAALVEYFRAAPPADAAWAVYFLAGGKPRQIVPVAALRELAQRAAGLPEWLFEESYQAVGDLAETIALLLPQAEHADTAGLAQWVEQRLLPLRGQPPETLSAALDVLWRPLDARARLVLFKLITGAFRVGVSKLLVTRALGEVAGVDPKRVAERLVGYTDISARPTPERFLALIAPTSATGEATPRGGQPYPFFLAHPLQAPVDDFDTVLGDPAQWLVEWKWDGIRAQLVRRDGQSWLWSRGEELITERFPELAEAARMLPDGTVLDGEIIVWIDGQVQPFALLQQRIGRKTLNAKLLREAPAILMAYDLLEWQGQDWRARPQAERRAQLARVIADHVHPALELSPLVQADDWPHFARLRETSRALGVEGFMFKAASAAYGAGRTRDVGVWWKWKIDPYTVDAVLVYAQRGHGRRASLYTDYTFAVWNAPPGAPERALVPFAKAYSGLTDEEIRAVDAIVRRTTVESFGPVRSVTPTQVFELGFEGIARSGRHKSGIAVRFPRMLRWRTDKPVDEADTLATLEAMLPAPQARDAA